MADGFRLFLKAVLAIAILLSTPDVESPPAEV